MPIYRVQGDSLEAVPPTTFAAAGVRERDDLQRLFRDRVEVIAPDVLVIAEEFGDWDDSRRRIDLLAVDRQANLVVIELKRTEDGGHMDLQAVRYAAMVSTLTFSRAIDVFADYLSKRDDDRDAEQTLLDFLGWDSAEDDGFATDVRLVLVSAEFSKEVTSSVLWLVEHGVDIRCLRLRPYGESDGVLLDVQQVIPLPEAEDYQVRVREKRLEDRSGRRSRRDTARFHVTVDGAVEESLPKRRAIHRIVQALCRHGVAPDQISEAIPWRRTFFLVVDHECDSADFTAAVLSRDGGKFDPRCWFLEDDELITHGGKTYAFTNQWGNRTVSAMQALVGQYGAGRISFEQAS